MKYLLTNEELSNPLYIFKKKQFLKSVAKSKKSLELLDGWEIVDRNTQAVYDEVPIERADFTVYSDGKSYEVSIFLEKKWKYKTSFDTEVKIYINGNWITSIDSIKEDSILNAILHYKRMGDAQEIINKEIEKEKDFFEEYDIQTMKDYLQDLSDCLGKYEIVEFKQSSYLITFTEFTLEPKEIWGTRRNSKFVNLSYDTEWMVEIDNLNKLLKNVNLKMALSIEKGVVLLISKESNS